MTVIPILLVTAFAVTLVAIIGKLAEQSAAEFNGNLGDGSELPSLDITAGGVMANSINAGDESTWPSGDKLWDFAHAIAVAEGYGADEYNGPTRNNNPGDLSDGADTFGYDPNIKDSKVTTFPDDVTGWFWLRNKLNRIVDGASTVYSEYARTLGLRDSSELSIRQLAQKWAGSWQNWSANVSRELGVTDSTKVKEFRS